MEAHKATTCFLWDKQLGQGGFGKVFAAYSVKLNRNVAVKISDRKQYYLNEVELLKKINHPNIIKILQVEESRSYGYIAMERIDGITLKEIVRKVKTREEDIAKMLNGILKALIYLHKQGIVHRDIKPGNIMLRNKEDYSSIVIIDFGVSAQYMQTVSFEGFEKKIGTPIYSAPEVLCNKNYYKAVDIWSTGMTIYQLLNQGIHPFEEDKKLENGVIRRLLDNPTVQYNENFSRLSITFLSRILQPLPSKRYTAEEAIKHPWVTRKHTRIPKTMHEKLFDLSVQDKFRSLAKVLIFASSLKQTKLKNEELKNTKSIIQRSDIPAIKINSLIRQEKQVIASQSHTFSDEISSILNKIEQEAYQEKTQFMMNKQLSNKRQSPNILLKGSKCSYRLHTMSDRNLNNRGGEYKCLGNSTPKSNNQLLVDYSPIKSTRHLNQGQGNINMNMNIIVDRSRSSKSKLLLNSEKTEDKRADTSFPIINSKIPSNKCTKSELYLKRRENSNSHKKTPTSLNMRKMGDEEITSVCADVGRFATPSLWVQRKISRASQMGGGSLIYNKENSNFRSNMDTDLRKVESVFHRLFYTKKEGLEYNSAKMLGRKKRRFTD